VLFAGSVFSPEKDRNFGCMSASTICCDHEHARSHPTGRYSIEILMSTWMWPSNWELISNDWRINTYRAKSAHSQKIKTFHSDYRQPTPAPPPLPQLTSPCSIGGGLFQPVLSRTHRSGDSHWRKISADEQASRLLKLQSRTVFARISKTD